MRRGGSEWGKRPKVETEDLDPRKLADAKDMIRKRFELPESTPLTLYARKGNAKYIFRCKLDDETKEFQIKLDKAGRLLSIAVLQVIR